MHEVKEKCEKIKRLKEKLMCDVEQYIEAGVFCHGVPGDAVGEVIDMIKDLCEAEEKLWKACYYKQIVEVMKEAKDEEELMEKMGMHHEGRQGYDNYRYASGRFAPKGHGHYAGYTPEMGRVGHPDMMMDEHEKTTMAGYPHHSMSRGSYHMTGRYGYPMDERYGRPYNDYEDARKHYHDSKDPDAKKEMSEHADRHLMDTIKTTKMIWSDADTDAKKQFKEDMMKLLKDMPA